MTEKHYKPETGSLVFAVFLSTLAAHAFTYQDIGRRQWGEIVTGRAAIAVGVLMMIMAVWAAMNYVVRSREQGTYSKGAISLFVLVAALCMASQWMLLHFEVSRNAAGLATLIVAGIAWPFVEFVHWLSGESAKQKGTLGQQRN